MDQLQSRLLQALTHLPETIIQRLAGRPIRRGERHLAPEAHLILTLAKVTREKPLDAVPLAKARRSLDRTTTLLAAEHPIGAVRDFTIAGRPARLYTPAARLGAEASPTMLYFHGGFHTYGSLDGHDVALRAFAENSGIQILSLDYRLAPEHPFPAGLDDCVAALHWLAGHPDQVGADPSRIAVGGDSAGGNLAAATVQLAADDIDLAFQLLVYPIADFTQISESRRSLGTGFFLTQSAMEQAAHRYLPDQRDFKDPRATIMNAKISSKTPPTLVVTAGFDPLRDEGIAYGEKLAEAGVAVEQREYSDMIHGFFNQVTAGTRGPRYNREIASAVSAALS